MTEDEQRIVEWLRGSAPGKPALHRRNTRTGKAEAQTGAIMRQIASAIEQGWHRGAAEDGSA